MKKLDANRSESSEGVGKAQNSIVSYFAPAQKKKLDPSSDEHRESKKSRINSGEDNKDIALDGIASKEMKIRAADPILRAELALIPDSWFHILYSEMCKPYFSKVRKNLLYFKFLRCIFRRT